MRWFVDSPIRFFFSFFTFHLFYYSNLVQDKQNTLNDWNEKKKEITFLLIFGLFGLKKGDFVHILCIHGERIWVFIKRYYEQKICFFFSRLLHTIYGHKKYTTIQECRHFSLLPTIFQQVSILLMFHRCWSDRSFYSLKCICKNEMRHSLFDIQRFILKMAICLLFWWNFFFFFSSSVRRHLHVSKDALYDQKKKN